MIEIHLVEKKKKRYKNVEVYDYEDFILELLTILNKSLPWYIPFKKKIREKFILGVGKMVRERLEKNINRKKNGK